VGQSGAQRTSSVRAVVVFMGIDMAVDVLVAVAVAVAGILVAHVSPRPRDERSGVASSW